MIGPESPESPITGFGTYGTSARSQSPILLNMGLGLLAHLLEPRKPRGVPQPFELQTKP